MEETAFEGEGRKEDQERNCINEGRFARPLVDAAASRPARDPASWPVASFASCLRYGL